MSQPSQDNRYMEFRLGDGLYAIPLLSVKEVIRKPDVVQVPNMPVHFEGMMNLRGQILGVFNVRRKLNIKAPEAAQDAANSVVVVIDYGGVNVGMIVDEVTRVLRPEVEMIREAPLKEDDPASVYVGAVIQEGEDLIMLVKINDLLELEKYKTLRRAA